MAAKGGPKVERKLGQTPMEELGARQGLGNVKVMANGAKRRVQWLCAALQVPLRKPYEPAITRHVLEERWWLMVKKGLLGTHVEVACKWRTAASQLPCQKLYGFCHGEKKERRKQKKNRGEGEKGAAQMGRRERDGTLGFVVF